MIKKNKIEEQGGKTMNATINEERYCTIQESIIESLKEMKLMREGKLPKRNLNDLWDKMNKWEEEEEIK